MDKKVWLLATTLMILTSVAYGGDLYKVTINSSGAAERLKACGVEPVARIADGYLVLAEPPAAEALKNSELDIQFLAAGLAKSDLALDLRRDGANISRYKLLYQEGDFRLYRVGGDLWAKSAQDLSLAPIRNDFLVIEYTESRGVDFAALRNITDLQGLIDQVKQDSLFAWTSRLQAYYRRLAGTDSSNAARDWLAAEFTSFGYDSVVIDSFTATVSGAPAQCQNVIAYKMGTRAANHQIIVGAHRDGVYNSPAADDNGSGTAAVLELARILKDVPTDLTFIFILFDSEEQGLNGAYHYANAAKSRGDSIEYMFNLDMIGHYQNSTQANLFHGPVTTYAQLWQHLADSLVGVTGTLAGSSGGSDHYPFVINGYQATFVAEYVFSTKYHSPSDSTTYMNFEYMTKIVKASLATVYSVDAMFIRDSSITFAFPDGLPSMVSPEKPDTFAVVVDGLYGGVPVPGSGRLHYAIDNGAFQVVTMPETSANNYLGIIPALDCGRRIRFYVSAEEATNGVFNDIAPDSAHEAYASLSEVMVFEDNFETDKGWTVSGVVVDGPWTRGLPVGLGERGDPPTDYDHSGSCYLTDNEYGNSDVDGGTTYLDSPIFDLAGENGRVRYARWYSNNFGSAPFADVFRVYISNDGGSNWTMAEGVGPIDQAGGGWFEHSFWVGNYVSPTSQMRLRFEASDLASGSVVEAAIDAVSVITYECPPSFVCGDANGDKTVNIGDAVYVINFIFKGGPVPSPLEAGDANCDGARNVGDAVYVVNYIFKGGPAPCCP